MCDQFDYLQSMTLQTIDAQRFILGRQTRKAIDAYMACARIIYGKMGSLGFSVIRRLLNNPSPSPDAQKGYMLAERLLEYYYLQLIGSTQLEDRAQAVVARVREQLDHKAQTDQLFAYLFESYLHYYEHLIPIELFDRIGVMHNRADATRHKTYKCLSPEVKQNHPDAVNNILREIERVAIQTSVMLGSQ
jgi:hypothetical protein